MIITEILEFVHSFHLVLTKRQGFLEVLLGSIWGPFIH